MKMSFHCKIKNTIFFFFNKIKNVCMILCFFCNSFVFKIIFKKTYIKREYIYIQYAFNIDVFKNLNHKIMTNVIPNPKYNAKKVKKSSKRRR